MILGRGEDIRNPLLIDIYDDDLRKILLFREVLIILIMLILLCSL